MISVSDTEFQSFVEEALGSLPKKYTEEMKNVVITTEQLPSKEQHEKMKLGPHQTLYGLYEGIPLTQRGNAYTFVLPDKITIFQYPIEASATTIEGLKSQIKHTLWHEIAHHFGLNHNRIHELEERF